MSNNIANVPLPRSLEVAHWIYQQQRLVSAREAVEVLGGSVWSMGQIFSKFHLMSNILVIDEQKIRSKGGMQTLIRIVYIYPYSLDEYQQPYRKREDTSLNEPLTWRDLVCLPWAQLAQINRLHNDE